MAVYEIINVGANKALNISGSNLKGTSLYNNQGITLWSRSGSSEQSWIFTTTSKPACIRSYLNREFGLNARKNSSIKYKCDIHEIDGNETDTAVGVEHISTGDRIKLLNYDLYLTADGTGNGATVSWAPESSSNLQLWKLNEKDVITHGKTTTLYGPVGNYKTGNLLESQRKTNAKYIYDFLIDNGFPKEAACAVLGNCEQESTFNPSVWQTLNDLDLGYGIVQWSPATKFLQWAVDIGLIASVSAAIINTLAKSSVQKLMDAELTYFIFTAALSGDYFSGNSFETFKNSTDSVTELAKTFVLTYEKTTSEIAKRQEYAQNWYEYF